MKSQGSEATATERGQVAWVGTKPIDWPDVQRLLAISELENQWTNFGPVSHLLEKRIADLFDLPSDLTVVATSSGTAALNAISALEEHKTGRPVRWVVSDFGFRCTRQGAFRHAIVVDCDDRGVLDIEELEGLDPSVYDAVLVTNPFGVVDDLTPFIEFGASAGKLVVADSAGAFDAAHRHGHPSPVEALSFHHTKPWGFGEGGAMVIRAEDELMARSVINFGLVAGKPIAGVATNGKLSDLAAAFIVSWLSDVEELRSNALLQFERIARIASECGWEVLRDDGGSRTSVPGCVPLTRELPVSIENVEQLPLTARKYYTPLTGRSRARHLFDRIVNLPCHADVAELSDAAIAATLRSLAN